MSYRDDDKKYEEAREKFFKLITDDKQRKTRTKQLLTDFDDYIKVAANAGVSWKRVAEYLTQASGEKIAAITVQRWYKAEYPNDVKRHNEMHLDVATAPEDFLTKPKV